MTAFPGQHGAEKRPGRDGQTTVLTRRVIYRYTALAGIVWTVVLGLSLGYETGGFQGHAENLARQLAVVVHNKDHAFRLWASDLPGLYVPVTPQTPPSPWLAHVKHRDIQGPDGLRLTLMNAAYIQRLVNDRFKGLSGVTGKVTSLEPINPANAPDEWEREGLEALARGEPELTRRTEIGGEPYLRVMRPFRIKESCLRCHHYRKLQIGDVGGADSTAIPLAPLLDAAEAQTLETLTLHFGYWLVGIGTILFVGRRTVHGLDERDRAEAEIIRARNYTQGVVGAVGEGLYGVDAMGRLVFLNPEGERLLGWREAELQGKPIHEHIHYLHPDRSPHPSSECPLLGVMREGHAYRSEDDVFLRKGGELFPVSCISTPLRADGQIVGSIIAFRDITEQKQAAEKLDHLAHHDGLTGLPNRSMLMDFLDLQLARARRYSSAVAMLFVDLDSFSLVNDTYGHVTGDQLLGQVADRLQQVIREPDMLARQGGDEFIVLLVSRDPQGDDTQQAVRIITESSLLVATRILDAIRPPYLVGGNEFYVNASIGVSVFPQDAEDGTTLLKNADRAMYHAKERGGSAYALFAGDLSDQTERWFRLETGLHRAMAKSEFQLFYQPLVDLNTGTLVGCEALIRWNSLTDGWIAPAEFIPVAERNGLIHPIGRWVLEEACRKAAAWRAQGHRLYVAVNLSVQQLLGGEAFAEEVLTTLEDSGVPPGSIELEITESAMAREPGQIQALVNAFHGYGIRLSLDDFGTGYSSLMRLRQLPFSTLKIDKSFVDGLPLEREDVEIVVSTIQLARNLGKEPLAEGIETAEQWRFLRAQGCALGQGYYFSRPLTAQDFEELLGRGQTWQL